MDYHSVRGDSYHTGLNTTVRQGHGASGRCTGSAPCSVGSNPLTRQWPQPPTMHATAYPTVKALRYDVRCVWDTDTQPLGISASPSTWGLTHRSVCLMEHVSWTMSEGQNSPVVKTALGEDSTQWPPVWSFEFAQMVKVSKLSTGSFTDDHCVDMHIVQFDTGNIWITNNNLWPSNPAHR